MLLFLQYLNLNASIGVHSALILTFIAKKKIRYYQGQNVGVRVAVRPVPLNFQGIFFHANLSLSVSFPGCLSPLFQSES